MLIVNAPLGQGERGEKERAGFGDHGKGLAADFIVGDNTELGNRVAADVTSNMTERGISYVIWQQQFYAPFESIYGPANTWNQMPDRGSVTENHLSLYLIPRREV